MARWVSRAGSQLHAESQTRTNSTAACDTFRGLVQHTNTYTVGHADSQTDVPDTRQDWAEPLIVYGSSATCCWQVAGQITVMNSCVNYGCAVCTSNISRAANAISTMQMHSWHMLVHRKPKPTWTAKSNLCIFPEYSKNVIPIHTMTLTSVRSMGKG